MTTRDLLLMGLFVLTNGAQLTHSLVANRRRGELQMRAPEYAKAIYIEGNYWSLHGPWPVRIIPLFSLKPPAAVRGSVVAIRALLVLSLIALLGFLAALMVSIRGQ